MEGSWYFNQSVSRRMLSFPRLVMNIWTHLVYILPCRSRTMRFVSRPDYMGPVLLIVLSMFLIQIEWLNKYVGKLCLFIHDSFARIPLQAESIVALAPALFPWVDRCTSRRMGMIISLFTVLIWIYDGSTYSGFVFPLAFADRGKVKQNSVPGRSATPSSLCFLILQKLLWC